MKKKYIKKQIARYARLMYEQGYSVDSEGNVSVRISKNRILITPSNHIKKFLKKDDIVEIDMKGNLVNGKGKPTSERFTHLEIYKNNPDVKAIVHAHPIYTVLATAMGTNPFEKPFLSEAAMFLSDVRFAPFARPSTTEGADAVKEICGQTNTLVLDRHGSFTYGKDLHTAFSLLEIMEKVAKLDYLARLSGKEIIYLTEEQIQALRQVIYG